MSACCSCTWCGRCAKSDRWIPVFVNWCRPGSWGRRSLQYTGEKTKKKLLFFFFLMTQIPFAVETVTQSLYLGAGWAHDRFVELSIYKHLQSLIKKKNVFCKEKKQHFFKSRFEKFFLCVPLTLYPYTKVPLLQPSSSSGGLSQPIMRLLWPTLLMTSTDCTSAGASAGDGEHKLEMWTLLTFYFIF